MKNKYFSGLLIAAMLAVGVSSFSSESQSQGLATCFVQPGGTTPTAGPIPCPTSAALPYFPLTSPTGNFADTANGNVSTYNASLIEGVPAAGATDVVCLTGSATKVVRLWRVELSGTQTTAGIIPISLNFNSAADTGGTAGTAPTIVKADTTDVAASATVIYYTASPTIVTSVGAVATQKVLLPAPAGTSSAPIYPLFMAKDSFLTKPVVIRGIAQQACVNWNAKTTAGNLLDVNFLWTETTN